MNYCSASSYQTFVRLALPLSIPLLVADHLHGRLQTVEAEVSLDDRERLPSVRAEGVGPIAHRGNRRARAMEAPAYDAAR